jgi:hypothetical protein
LGALFASLPLALSTVLFSGGFQPNTHDKFALLFLMSILLVYFMKLFAVEHFWMYDMSVGFFAACSIGFFTSSMLKSKEMNHESGGSRIFHEEGSKEDTITAIQKNFAVICVSATIAFILVYLLAATQVIGSDVAVVLNVVTDTFFRLLFTITALDVHVTLFQNIEAELRSEKKSHNRRKAFMKYIFHEM